MASNYGDETGGKLLDWMLRIGQEAGAEASGHGMRPVGSPVALARVYVGTSRR